MSDGQFWTQGDGETKTRQHLPPPKKSRILVSTLFVDLKINKKLKQILMFKTINNDNNDMV